ncbi:hypothetical protein WJX79_007251 [Trebouxia sp. C0005]
MQRRVLFGGLTISTNKTEVLVVGKDAAKQPPNAVITIKGESAAVKKALSVGLPTQLAGNLAHITRSLPKKRSLG